MKKLVLAIVIATVGLVSCKGEKKEKKVEVKQAQKVETPVKKEGNVNVSTSVITWTGTKPTGSHTGTINLDNGSLTIEEGKLKGGEFTFDMKSIACTDLKAGDGKEDLEGHLNSEDFFNINKYPTSKFVITSTEEKDGKLAVTGNLTVKDVTKSITIPATVSEADGITTFKSEPFKVDRTEFGIQYKSKKFFDNLKNKFIDDLIGFSFDIKVKK